MENTELQKSESLTVVAFFPRISFHGYRIPVRVFAMRILRENLPAMFCKYGATIRAVNETAIKVSHLLEFPVAEVCAVSSHWVSSGEELEHRQLIDRSTVMRQECHVHYFKRWC